MAAAPGVKLTDVTHRYIAPDGRPQPPVLENVSLTLAAGSAVALLGASGAGKSTLLNLIAGLETPTAGRIEIDGVDSAGLSDRDRSALRNRTIGIVFQAHHLLPQCSALENVLVPTLAGTGPLTPDAAVQRAQALLRRVGLGERLHHRPGLLSGGERQRVAVVRALIHRPQLLLADEPTGALDRASADSLTDLLLELNREEGVSLLVATHDPALAGRMNIHYRLEDGRLVNGKHTS